MKEQHFKCVIVHDVQIEVKMNSILPKGMGAPYFYFTPPSLQQLFNEDRAPILFLKKKDQTHF